jgi:hypothetical protein
VDAVDHDRALIVGTVSYLHMNTLVALHGALGGSWRWRHCRWMGRARGVGRSGRLLAQDKATRQSARPGLSAHRISA